MLVSVVHTSESITSAYVFIYLFVKKFICPRVKGNKGCEVTTKILAIQTSIWEVHLGVMTTKIIN